MPLPAQKSLKTCLKGMSNRVLNNYEDVCISGIAWDSRKVNPGDIFFALVGENYDGHQFVSQAVERGAAAVIGSRSPAPLAVPYVQVSGEDRIALAKFSAAFYDFPSKKLVVIGVTGTDGKTTTTNLVYQILKEAGLPVGMISTVNAVIGEEVLDTGFHVTTPESPDIQYYLARMVDAGLSHVVLETTSHGLAQKRVAEVAYDLAAVTNVTHEHLDYHGTYQEYLAAKGMLFEMLGEDMGDESAVGRIAVLNKDDESYAYLSKRVSDQELGVQQIAYGLDASADLWADAVENTPGELRFAVHGPGAEFAIQTPLIGRYNVYNGLAALGLTVFGLGISPAVAQRAFQSIDIIPGRMERIDLGQDFLAVVDFAHTPNAIRQALMTARELTTGRVIVVFGSAGLRDREKRRMMPEIAADLADVMILTAEDPRTESLAEILDDMASGAEHAGAREGQDFWRVPDRGTAIRRAVAWAMPGDLVVVCGKGHEQSMCFGHVEYAWDDRVAMRAALSGLLGLEGPEMPHLPTSPDA